MVSAPNSPQRPAAKAAVQYDAFSAADLDGLRLHHAAAWLAPVSGIYVNMPAPEAVRAVISVTGALHLFSTILAGEALDSFLEPFAGHARLLIWPQMQHNSTLWPRKASAVTP